MRPVVVYALLSLDGTAESPDQFIEEWDDELDANLAAVIGEQDTVLLGRRMYDEWSVHWPGSDMEPFSSFINSVPKYVFSSTPLSRDWSCSTRVGGRAEEFVARLKQTPGRAIGVHGSLILAGSLLRAGLVDQLRLVVAPVTAGTGRPLFDAVERDRWRLRDARSGSSGALIVHYDRRTD
ncbi:MAG TPA: dihydrofolate reductase family protein [Microlunatus sp.]|nr:dihydrofolate reductase family protein [Microlunatus sp.]